MCKITSTQNEAGQYSHDNIRLVAKQIKHVLAGKFNPSASGSGMVKLLEATSNTLTNRKNTDSYNTDSVLQAARNIATAAATTPAISPPIVLRPDAQEEAENQNRFT